MVTQAQQARVNPQVRLHEVTVAQASHEKIVEMLVRDGPLDRSLRFLYSIIFFLKQHPDESAEAEEVEHANKFIVDAGSLLRAISGLGGQIEGEIARLEGMISQGRTLLEQAKEKVKKTIEKFKEELKFIKGLEAYVTAEAREEGELKKHLDKLKEHLHQEFMTHTNQFASTPPNEFNIAKQTMVADLTLAMEAIEGLLTLHRKDQRLLRREVNDETNVGELLAKLQNELAALQTYHQNTTGNDLPVFTELARTLGQLDEDHRTMIKHLLALERESLERIEEVKKQIEGGKKMLESLEDYPAYQRFYSANKNRIRGICIAGVSDIEGKIQALRTDQEGVDKIMEVLSKIEGVLQQFEAQALS